ncbi:class III extradiol ring-cleavage dioxygenase [Chitinophaga sp.]|uniref:dioxygenase family protein n=1 Tax=Chitinophaga sp. TaxID=1869181 RepID=UPI0031D97BE0
MENISALKNYTDQLLVQSKKMPVLFTSHGNPMNIIMSRDEHPFWNALYHLGIELKNSYDVKAAVVISAHWCTNGTFVNQSAVQQQIFDYYGFPEAYYKVHYHAKGAPEFAHEVKKAIPQAVETAEWGLDHGAWPMLMHLFPDADIPVFELSLDYYAKPEYHYALGQQLKSLRRKGVLIIGSGALIHNLSLVREKMQFNDMTPFGWEADYDAWLKKQVDQRNFEDIVQYASSHPLGKLAAPTPDHFVPVLYSLGLSEPGDDIRYFYEAPPLLPAFSERSFIIGG